MTRKRSNTRKQESNFKANLKTVAIKTTNVVFGVPHFMVALTAHQIAQTEASVIGLINWNSKDHDKLVDARKKNSEIYIHVMESKIDGAIEDSANYLHTKYTDIKAKFNKNDGELA